MNWIDHYQKLIEKRRKDKPEGYTENHHIFPKHMGGMKTPENMIRLTAKEHFIAHLLLMKIYPGQGGLISAAFWMSNTKQYGSRKYAWLKEKFSRMMSERMTGKKRGSPSEETRKKMSEAQKGIPKSEESKKKMKEAIRPAHSEETLKKMSLSNLGKNSGKMPSDEARKKMSEAHTGRIFSEETRKKMRDAQITYWSTSSRKRSFA